MADDESPIEIQERIAIQIAELAPGEWARAEMTLENLDGAFDSVIIYWDSSGRQFYPKGRGKLFYDFEKLRDAIAKSANGTSFSKLTFKMDAEGDYNFDYEY